MRRYLILFVLSSLCTAMALAAINWNTDPYAIFQTRGLLALNEVRPLLTLNERVFKTVRLARENPIGIVLGTSRADIGIDANYPALGGKQAVSLATFGQPIAESRQLMALAAKQGKLKTVVIGLDFFAFNALFPYPSDFDQANFSDTRPAQLAFSVTTSLDSWKQRKRKVAEAGDCCFSNGVRYPNRADAFLGHYRSHFMSSERMYLLEKYRPSPACDFSFSLPGRSHRSTLDELRAMVALAHEKNIALKMFVSPSHARQWEVLASAGLTEKWEEWKRALVQINVEEAGHARREPFPLWDFSGYNAISSEAVPLEGDMQTRMRWYSDSSHYTPALGKLVLDRMFGMPIADVSLPVEFGVLLMPAILEQHLLAIRRDQLVYRDAHPDDVAEIARIAKETERRKYCATSAN
jgi:hypothetical protein